MTPVVFTIQPDQTVDECMDLMTQRRIRHVPVMEGDTLLGIISIGDVVNHIIHRQRKTISRLEGQTPALIDCSLRPAKPGRRSQQAFWDYPLQRLLVI